jgi:hypothetical protein
VGRKIVAGVMADKFTNLKQMLESEPVGND